MTDNPQIRGMIQAMTARLVEAYAPERIILYGSQAAGTPRANSDIDFLVIKPTTERMLERMARVRELVSGLHPHVPIEPLVLTPSELDERLRAGDQFFAAIVSKGEVLYSA